MARAVTEREVVDWIASNLNNAAYFETSAKDGTNVDNLFEAVGKALLRAQCSTD